MKKLFLFFIFLSAFVSCGSETTETDKCEGVTCSDWQQCNSTSGICEAKSGRCNAHKDCSDGNICDENHNCVEPINVCKDVTCSNHGICVVENNTAKCNCDSGYHSNALTCIADTVDLCENINCDEWKECNPLNGACELKQGRCDSNSNCEATSICDVTHNCILTNPCANQTCSAHGTCVVENNSAKCNCDSGYHSEGLTCVIDVTNLCENVNCFEWKECNPLNGACVLKTGRCESTSACSNGEICNTTTHICENLCSNVICDEWQTCNSANGMCRLNQGRCILDTDCIIAGEECYIVTHTCEIIPRNCSNVDCSQFINTHCEVQDDIASCYCDFGYVVNANQDGCEIAPECVNFDCSQYANTHCGVENSEPSCYCLDGYIVNATGDGCEIIPECTDDTIPNEITAALLINIPYNNTHHSCTTKYDFFKINLTAGTPFFADLAFATGDLDLYLLNAPELIEANLVASSAQEGTTSESFSYIAEATQTYYLVVAPYRLNDTDYTISLNDVIFETGTISQIRQAQNNIAIDDTVKTTGTVMSVVYSTTTPTNVKGIYIQESANDFSGIYIYVNPNAPITIANGDNIEVIAKVMDYHGWMELNTTADKIVVSTHGNTLFTAKDTVVTALGEANESMLVNITGGPFTVTEVGVAGNGYNTKLADANGNILVMRSTIYKFNEASGFAVGTVYTTIKGIVLQYDTVYSVQPRSADDLIMTGQVTCNPACDEGFTCQNNICVIIECSTDSECGVGFTCQNYVCLPITCSPVCPEWKTCTATNTCTLTTGRCETNANCSGGATCNTTTHICTGGINPQFANGDFSTWTDDTTPANWTKGNFPSTLLKVTRSGTDYALNMSGTAIGNSYLISSDFIAVTNTFPSSITFEMNGSGKMSINIACDLNADGLTTGEQKFYNLTGETFSNNTSLNMYNPFDTTGTWKTFTITTGAELNDFWKEGTNCRLEIKGGKTTPFNASIDNIRINY